MRAIVGESYGTADALELRDIDRPEISRDEVLVRVDAAGLDRGVWHVMTGLPYPIRLAGYGLRAPKNPVPGMDLAGTVQEVGAGVTRFAPGDAVFGIGKGTFAEFARAAESKLAAMPTNLTRRQAAVVAVSGLPALQGLRDHGKVGPGQRVLVIGASGGVGTYAVQLAKAFGTEVTGVCSTTKVDLVRSLGADHVIDYTREDFADGTRRWDLIVDNAGRRPLSVLRRALGPRGTLVIVGGDGGGRWTGGFFRQILRAPLLSLVTRQKLRPLTAKERREDLQALAEMIEAGMVTPVVGRTCPLADAPEAVRELERGHARGKVVVVVRT
jgi:NADPH:quinone reductase-like Zn-dependent oxidoreductase